jgi:hypothetical protein
MTTKRESCNRCGGVGAYSGKVCPVCNGQGITPPFMPEEIVTLRADAEGNYKASKYAQGRVDELLQVNATLEKERDAALLQNDELREIVRWFANALEMNKEKLGRTWSFGYWEGSDPGLALVNGGEQGIENSRFNAALQLTSGERGRILAAVAQKPIGAPLTSQKLETGLEGLSCGAPISGGFCAFLKPCPDHETWMVTGPCCEHKRLGPDYMKPFWGPPVTPCPNCKYQKVLQEVRFGGVEKQEKGS